MKKILEFLCLSLNERFGSRVCVPHSEQFFKFNTNHAQAGVHKVPGYGCDRNQWFLSHFYYNMSSETQVCKMLLLFTICLIFVSPGAEEGRGEEKGYLNNITTFFKYAIRTYINFPSIWPLRISKGSSAHQHLHLQGQLMQSYAGVAYGTVQWFSRTVEILCEWNRNHRMMIWVRFWPWRGLRVHSEQLSGT